MTNNGKARASLNIALLIDADNAAPASLDPVLTVLAKLEAVAASKRDERGFASLSEVGKLVGNRSPFDTRNYGFARLVDLVEAIPKFAVERRSGTGVHIRRIQ